MPTRFYWQNILNLTPEIEEEFADTFDKLRNSQNSPGLLLVDESQDLSGQQLQDLKRYSGPAASMILFAGDCQNLNDQISPIPFMQQLLHRPGSPRIEPVEFPGSYRMPRWRSWSNWNWIIGNILRKKGRQKHFPRAIRPEKCPHDALHANM